MPYTPNNHPYIPGDPYSYDLKWLVRSQKESIAKADQASAQAAQAVSDAASALTAAGAAATAAANASNFAGEASAQAAAAGTAADQAAASAASAIEAVNESITAEVIPGADWIDSEQSTVTVIDQFGVRIGNLFFFRVYFRASEDHRLLYFKAPYDTFIAPVPFPVYTKSTTSGPYDTFDRLNVAGVNTPYLSFANFTSNMACVSGILILRTVQ